MQWLKRSMRSPPGVVMMFWFLTWMQVTCERRFTLWTIWLSFVYTLSCPFSSVTRQKNQPGCVSFANSSSVILAAAHWTSLALAPSTHDSISLWRHSVWKRRVWARNQKTQLYPCIIDIRKMYSLFWNMYLHPYKHPYSQDNADDEHINHPAVSCVPW